MEPLTIAVGQATAVPLDVDANAHTAIALLHEAAAAGARLLLLPELFLTGGALDAPAIPRRDPVIARLAAACKDTNACLALGAPTPKSGRRRVSVLVFGPRRESAGRYDKRYLEEHELAAGYEPGEENGGTAGFIMGEWGVLLASGRDATVSAHARDRPTDMHLYAVSGLFAEAATVQEIGSARAAETGLFVAISNHVGSAGGVKACGHSGIWSPDGTRLAEGGDANPGITVARLDPSAYGQAP